MKSLPRYNIEVYVLLSHLGLEGLYFCSVRIEVLSKKKLRQQLTSREVD